MQHHVIVLTLLFLPWVSASAQPASEDTAIPLRAVVAISSNKVDGLSLPADQQVSTEQRVVIITAETTAAEVKWLIANKTQSPVAALEMAALKSLLIFPNANDDVITVRAYAAVNGKPTDAARTVITTKGPGSTNKPAPVTPEVKPEVKPQPKPLPTPDPIESSAPEPGLSPLVPTAKLHVTMIFDRAKMTPARQAIEKSATLRAALVQAGHKLHILSLDQPQIDKSGLRPYVNRAGNKDACLILQVMAATPAAGDGEVRRAVPLPTDEPGILDLIARTLTNR